MPNPSKIAGYRAGENLPLNLYAPDVVNTAQAVKTGLITPEQLLARILLEGREDAGANSIDRNNPNSVAYKQQLESNGISESGARLAALLREKTAVAKRLGISLDEAWNGTGRSSVGLTGKDYAQRAVKFRNVAADPRNGPLLDLIKQSATNTLPPEQKLLSALLHKTAIPTVYGDVSPEEATNSLGDYQTYSGSRGYYHHPGPPIAQDYLNGVYQDLETAYPDGISGGTISKAVGNLTIRSLNDLLEFKTRQALGAPRSDRGETWDYNNLAPEGQAAINRMARTILKTYGVPPPEPLPPGIGAPGTYP